MTYPGQPKLHIETRSQGKQCWGGDGWWVNGQYLGKVPEVRRCTLKRLLFCLFEAKSCSEALLALASGQFSSLSLSKCWGCRYELSHRPSSQAFLPKQMSWVICVSHLLTTPRLSSSPSPPVCGFSLSACSDIKALGWDSWHLSSRPFYLNMWYPVPFIQWLFRHLKIPPWVPGQHLNLKIENLCFLEMPESSAGSFLWSRFSLL